MSAVRRQADERTDSDTSHIAVKAPQCANVQSWSGRVAAGRGWVEETQIPIPTFL